MNNLYYNYYSVMYYYGFATNKDVWDMTSYGFLTVEEYKKITKLDFDLDNPPVI